MPTELPAYTCLGMENFSHKGVYLIYSAPDESIKKKRSGLIPWDQIVVAYNNLGQQDYATIRVLTQTDKWDEIAISAIDLENFLQRRSAGQRNTAQPSS